MRVGLTLDGCGRHPAGRTVCRPAAPASSILAQPHRPAAGRTGPGSKAKLAGRARRLVAAPVRTGDSGGPPFLVEPGKMAGGTAVRRDSVGGKRRGRGAGPSASLAEARGAGARPDVAAVGDAAQAAKGAAVLHRGRQHHRHNGCAGDRGRLCSRRRRAWVRWLVAGRRAGVPRRWLRQGAPGLDDQAMIVARVAGPWRGMWSGPPCQGETIDDVESCPSTRGWRAPAGPIPGRV